MKTKLLKELRKQAYKDFGIKDSFKTEKGDVFIVGYKGLNTGNDKAFFSLDEAKKEVFRMRHDYCLMRHRCMILFLLEHELHELNEL